MTQFKASYKIFIVDDDAYHLNVMARILTNLGQNDVTLFDNGVDCLNSLHLKPSVIFLDHHMDIYNGKDVLKKIKRYDPNVFVIMVSGQDEMQVAIDSLKNGAFDYLRKETNLQEQVSTILNKIYMVSEAIANDKTSIFKKFFK